MVKFWLWLKYFSRCDMFKIAKKDVHSLSILNRSTSMSKNSIKLFEGQKVRSVWDESKEEWYFSVVDIVAILTEQPDYAKVRNYWKWLKNRLIDEGSKLVSNTNQLKLPAADGKNYLTDVMDTEQILRLIQSIPSKKAEPFKLWLAEVGKDRIEETIDPEKSINRALETYLKKGYSPEWINQRLQAIQVRKELTDEWQKRGVKKGNEFAILTDEITKAWANMTTREYKNLKGLKKENLRDNMTTTEIILNMLAETATKNISQAKKPRDLQENKKVANQGGGVAKHAREEIEQLSGKSVITAKNSRQIDG